MRRCGILALACALCVTASWAKKKKTEEELTQTRDIPKDPPAVTTADSRRLAFYVSPLSGKGLLSQQVRDALKAVMRWQTGIVRIRAFVAGSGDLRRVRDIVSETFTDKKLPLPVLTVVRTGALPMEGAQVVMEATAVGKKEMNPKGIVFLPAQPATAPDPLAAAAPLASQSLTELQKSAQAHGEILRLTCFLSSLEGAQKLRDEVRGRYASAAINFVQVQRAPGHAVGACEAIARAASAQPFKIALTGAQAAFGFEESDIKLAFQRLAKDMEATGASPKNVIFASYYPLAGSIMEMARKNGFPGAAVTALVFDGLSSMDSSFAVDAVASMDK